MARRAVIHPRIFDSIPQFFPSRCTIQQGEETRSGSGARSVEWDNVRDLINIACSVAPIVTQTTGESETSRQEMTLLMVTHQILLRGYFPEISTSQRAVVDGEAYDIRSVENDSQKTMTRLRVKKVTL